MSFKIRPGHPRVLIRPDDLPALRRRASTTHAPQMQALLQLAERDAGPGSSGDWWESVWRLSFLYLLSGERAHADAAIMGVRKLLEFPVDGEYRTGSTRLKALAAAYDWLHDALDHELRQQIGTTALRYCQALHDSGEVEPGCYFLGHAINEIPYILMAAVAIGDEIDGAQRFIDDVMQRWHEQAKGYRHFLEQDCFQMSMSYTSTYVGEFPYLFNAIEAGLGIEMYRPNAWWANVIRWWTYGLRDDESFLRFGDYFCAVPALENAQYYRAVAAIASRYRDGRAQWLLSKFRLTGSEPEQIIFEDRPGVVPIPPDTNAAITQNHTPSPGTPGEGGGEGSRDRRSATDDAGRAEPSPNPLPEYRERAKTDLPRTNLFKPMGLAVARGDFDRGTVAAFKCTPHYLHNHGHRDANSFTIYHKGELAIDSGAYDGYETPQWYNYYIRTIAHNTIVVYDPSEKFISRGKKYANDGGQRFINEPHFQPTRFEHLEGGTYRDGKILVYREGEDWSYVCGDASNCYSRDKLTKFLRHVTFILDWPQPKCVSLVVLDEVEVTRDELEPRFLLHTMNEPIVDGNTITAKHGGGRLIATVLLPASPRIETIGGSGREFEVDGENYPLNRKLGPAYTPGAWRAEVTGTTGRSRRFLTVLTPTDADAAPPPPVTLEEPNGALVVRQGELSVALTRAGQRIKPGFKRSLHIELAS